MPVLYVCLGIIIGLWGPAMLGWVFSRGERRHVGVDDLLADFDHERRLHEAHRKPDAAA